MKGGSRRSGRAPDPNALKRERDNHDWVTLPPQREGDAPEWPLRDQTAREATLWLGEWKRPQAVMWEENGQEVEVAMYVRNLVEAESPDASTASRTLLRQHQEALGLSIPGLQRNKWRISGESKPVAPSGTSTRVTSSAKDRLKVVQGGK